MFDQSKAYDLKISKEGKNGCWKWLGLKDKNGYGHFWHGGRKRNVRAHRYSLELSTGHVGTGLMALHSCDNPECCNPDHLRWGTAAENSKDMKDRGRSCEREGEKNPVSKLKDSDVLQIRSLYPKESAKELANKFGISVRNVYRVVKGEGWPNIPGGTGPKNLRRTGQDSPRSILNDGKVIAIRRMAQTHTYAEISKIIGVDKSVVSKVVNRKSWAHVKSPA